MEVGSPDCGNHKSWGPVMPGLPSGSPRPAEASPGVAVTSVSKHSPHSRDQSVASNLRRRRPVCMWGLVVWTGFVNLPTKARFCNNQGTQAILVPPATSQAPPGSHCQGRAV